MVVKTAKNHTKTGWVGLKYFFTFTPKIGEDDPISVIFFKWVETTNQ